MEWQCGEAPSPEKLAHICSSEGNMTDEDLARHLHLTPAEATKVIPRLTPEKRAAYERLGQFADDWNLYAAGFGPRPTGALVDTERSMKRRKLSRLFLKDC